MASRDMVALSEEFRIYLSTTLALDWEESNNDSRKGLRLTSSITPKQLFFNQSEQRSIDRLVDLLQDENFKGIQSRLASHGMRKGFACLFYGAPGTGKTETVYQLARLTGRDIMEVNIANIRSKWVGESEKNIKNIFSRYQLYYKRCSRAPILLFNEADAVISKRNSNVDRSVDKMENAFQNIILEEIEKLEGILIATTNLTTNMDAAFERRFLYKIEFHLPEEEAKTHIWCSMLEDLKEEDARVLARQYNFSGGQIENVVRKQIVDHILYNKDLNLVELNQYCQMENIHTSNERRAVVGFR